MNTGILATAAPVPWAPPVRPRLRVLDITTFYAAASGGVKTYLDAKVRDFASRHVAHSLVVPGETAGMDSIGRTRVHRLRSPRIPLTGGYRLLVSAVELERILAVERPHVIEVGSPFLVPFLVRWAADRRPVRTVGFYHTDLAKALVDPYTKRLGPRARELARTAARRYVQTVYSRFDVTVAASPTVAEDLRRMGIPDVRYVPLGVDLNVFRPDRADRRLRNEVGAEPGVPVALYVGRFCAEKRLDVLLEAHDRLGPEQPHLVLVGDGPDRSALETLARRRPRLTILPYEADRWELARIYASADFYVAPGPAETFGLAIAEAMASGLPVVAVNSGAAPDRVAGSGCGRLYRPGDVDDCAAALRAMAGEATPRLRDRARDHARATFGWHRTFDTLYEIYAELADTLEG